MKFPAWVQERIDGFTPPATGKIVIELECYQGGISKIEMGAVVRFKADYCMTCAAGEACHLHPEKSSVKSFR